MSVRILRAEHVRIGASLSILLLNCGELEGWIAAEGLDSKGDLLFDFQRIHLLCWRLIVRQTECLLGAACAWYIALLETIYIIDRIFVFSNQIYDFLSKWRILWGFFALVGELGASWLDFVSFSLLIWSIFCDQLRIRNYLKIVALLRFLRITFVWPHFFDGGNFNLSLL